MYSKHSELTYWPLTYWPLLDQTWLLTPFAVDSGLPSPTAYQQQRADVIITVAFAFMDNCDSDCKAPKTKNTHIILLLATTKSVSGSVQLVPTASRTWSQRRASYMWPWPVMFWNATFSFRRRSCHVTMFLPGPFWRHVGYRKQGTCHTVVFLSAEIEVKQIPICHFIVSLPILRLEGNGSWWFSKRHLWILF